MPIIKKGYARRCVPVGARSAADGARGERTGTPAREAISAKEAAGAKDVVPRTAIDLIRALPDSFSSGRSLPSLPPSSRCDVLLQHCPRFPPGPRRSRSLVAFLFSTPLRAVPSLRPPFSALLLLHQRWQPAYRQSSFSILRGAAPPPPSLSLPVPGIVLSLRHVYLLPFLGLFFYFLFYLRCVAP